ncbi:MAG: MCP four helix bundle domain-containing protein [Burkholderiaceae bacterium]|nr:MCP four helix bundle domain-containing protein [Burkholderiaceae bacterium]
MIQINQLRIGARLALGFAAVLMLTLGIGLLAINRLGAVNANTAEIATNWLPSIRLLGQVRGQLVDERRFEANHLMSATDAQRKAEEDGIAKATAAMGVDWKQYMATVTTDEERKLADAALAARKTYVEVQKRVLAQSREGSPDAQSTYQGDGRKAFAEVLAAVQKLMDFQVRGSDQAYAEAQASFNQTRLMVGGLLLAALAAGGLLAWLITRSIVVPIRQAVAVAETVARGDLRSRITVSGGDEAAQLLGALQRMNGELLRIVGSVRGNADSVATASSQIAQGNIDLSQRTEEQASNLQQTAASMEQLTATVKQNSDTAQQAAQLAGSAAGVAAQGGEVMGRVVQTMQDISASSKKIADIIGTIDGIAFQTNILALNAAVEAARAGEQGRGFAVVAGEVRNLAQRSAEAAKEIKSLIGASVEKVEVGTHLVGDAGQTMAEIVTQVRRVNDLISEISAASAEQTSGIGQVGDAVAQMDQVTQQNAALVEESAAAAESLRVQAGQLSQAVAFFTLEGREAKPAPAAVPAKPVAKPAAAVAAVPAKPRPAPAKPVASATPAPRPAQPAIKPAAKPAATASAASTPADDDDWTSF